MSKHTNSMCAIYTLPTNKEIWKRGKVAKYGRVDTGWLIPSTEMLLNDNEGEKKKG